MPSCFFGKDPLSFLVKVCYTEYRLGAVYPILQRRARGLYHVCKSNYRWSRVRLRRAFRGQGCCKSRLAYAFSSVGSPEVMNGLSASDYLWTVQRKVILDLAEKGNCVIVGRCADYILEDRDDVLNVFVHAGKDYRAKRIVLLYGETDKPPAKRLAEKDKKRALNYRHYTGREWGDVHNYDLSLDSGRLTPEGCVEIITRVVQEKNK